MLGTYGLMVIFDGLLQWLNIGEWDDNGIYPLVNIQKTMEHHHVQSVNPLFRLGHFQ